MGHVTLLAEDVGAALDWVRTCGIWP